MSPAVPEANLEPLLTHRLRRVALRNIVATRRVLLSRTTDLRPSHDSEFAGVFYEGYSQLREEIEVLADEGQSVQAEQELVLTT